MSESINPYASAGRPAASVAAVDVPRLEPPQTVRFHYSAELLTAFWSHRTLNSPVENRIRRKTARQILLFGGIPPAALLVLAWLGDIPPWMVMPAAGFLLLIVAIAYQSRRPSAVRLAIAQQANRLLDEAPNTRLLSERTVTLDERGIREVMPTSEAFTRWEAYEQIDHTDDYLFIYDSSFSAVVIPRAALATQAQFLGIVALAERLWEEKDSAKS